MITRQLRLQLKLHALWCVQDYMQLRPPMTKVVQMLEGLCDAPHPATPSQLTARVYSGFIKWNNEERVLHQDGVMTTVILGMANVPGRAEYLALPEGPEFPVEPEHSLPGIGSRICVKNLPKYMAEDRLREVFSQKGEITDSKLMRTKDGKSRQFAFIGFRTEQEAEEAIKYFNRSFLDTCRLTCEIAHKVGDPNMPRPWSRHSLKKEKKVTEDEKNLTGAENGGKRALKRAVRMMILTSRIPTGHAAKSQIKDVGK
ncbi:hypothetical protein LWI29_019752 [Acer saccharum]|uniref:RRM domain-containing protein n=1 Tax=Acer saccharum TaxID=4024 RepID=A0AA39T537_ACESA|nr:hypothetical protein LWI29_019752 [Acer saccharum]